MSTTKPQLMRSMRLLILICVSFLMQSISAQDSTAVQLPSKYFETVSKKADNLEKSLDKKSQKALDRMKKSEAGLKRKLAGIDSIAANNIFFPDESPPDQY